jgi:parallel beta-helix repeat protein
MLAGLTLASPGAVRATDCNVYTVTGLNYCFSQAEANPQTAYNVYLRSTNPYVLTHTLTLTQGTVYLQSPTGALSSANQYTVDAGYPGSAVGWKQAFRVVKGTSGYTPYLTVTGITIKGGLADQTAGGGVYVKDAYVALMNCYLSNNASTSLGSGLYVDGPTAYAYIYNSIVRDNKNLYAAPSIPSQVLCGGVQASGGGLAVNTGATLTVEKSTIMGNQSCRGGGIAAYNPSNLNVTNSTISGNKANLTGGGIFLMGNVATTLSFNTISENQAGVVPTGGSGYYDEKYGGGIGMMQWEGVANLHGNIIAKNQTVNSDKKTLYYDGNDCFDRFSTQSLWNRNVSFDWNFVGALANCHGFLAQSDGWWYVGWEGSPADPLLDPISQKTGTDGPQYTYAPKSTSGVIGNYWASDWNCPYSDQLGHRRDYYDHDYYSPTRCDMGSHQYNWYH